MMMKKLFLLFVLAGAMPLSMMAQDDDLYFTPSKKTAGTTSSSVKNSVERPTYYAGSSRDVDEYNRRGKFRSSYQKIGTDSVGNDIIEFHPGTGIYPDSAYVDTLWVSPQEDFDEDYAYSRRMSRWDDYYGWYDPWYFSRWGWHPFGYYSWYDPWYYGPYGWYGSWYDPWYYGYYGWGYPYGWYAHWGWGYPYHYYWGGYYGGGYAYSTGVTGTQNHGRASYNGPRGTFNGRSHSYASGTFGGSRSAGFGNRNSAKTGNTRSVSRSSRGSYSNSNGNFGGSRSSYDNSNSNWQSNSSYSAPARSSSSSSSSYGGGGSFGGSRSGSSGGGGGSRSGGGGFGGRR